MKKISHKLPSQNDNTLKFTLYVAFFSSDPNNLVFVWKKNEIKCKQNNWNNEGLGVKSDREPCWTMDHEECCCHIY